jgi:phosphatidylinositol alpha-mannosyltransferase
VGGALPKLVEHSGGEVLVVGRGDEAALDEQAGGTRPTCASSVRSTTPTKASALRSADLYCAPYNGGRELGFVLVEAMAAGTAGGWPATWTLQQCAEGGPRAVGARRTTPTRWPTALIELLRDARP